MLASSQLSLYRDCEKLEKVRNAASHWLDVLNALSVALWLELSSFQITNRNKLVLTLISSCLVAAQLAIAFMPNFSNALPKKRFYLASFLLYCTQSFSEFPLCAVFLLKNFLRSQPRKFTRAQRQVCLATMVKTCFPAPGCLQLAR